MFHAVRVANRNAHSVEEVVQFAVVGSEKYQTFAFFLYQFLDGIVVVALVLAANDEDDRSGHAFECIPAGIHVGGFGVVDVLHAGHHGHFL